MTTLSRFIFCILAVGLAVAGGNALDRAWHADQGEDEAALPEVVVVDIAGGVQTRPIDFGHTRAIALVTSSADCENCALTNRGVRWAPAGRTLLSLHTLLME